LPAERVEAVAYSKHNLPYLRLVNIERWGLPLLMEASFLSFCGKTEDNKGSVWDKVKKPARNHL
jgi:hypothetical protein